MKKRSQSIVTLLTLTAALFAKTDTLLSDFNADSHLDTMLIEKSLGSGASSTFITLINGINGERHSLDYSSAYSQFRIAVTIPPALRLKENRPFLKAFEKEILPPLRTTPDPSLQWILTGLQHKRELPEHSFFRTVITSPLQWHPTGILPAVYSIQEDSLYRVYFGHNHFRNPRGDSLETVWEKGPLSLQRTSHGLYLNHKDKGDAWLFVSDAALTGAPSKLRWESMKKIRVLQDRYILLIRSMGMGPDNLWCFDMQSGTIAEVRVPYDDFLKLSFVDGQVRIEGEEKKYEALSYTDILSACKKLTGM